jgi:tetratricopeptide (TPR) repeat protein
LFKTFVENLKVCIYTHDAYYLILLQYMKRIKKEFLTLIFAVFCVFFSHAQEKDFDIAIDLFEKKQYLIAQSLLQELNSDQALFYNAKCSKNLFADDAKELFKQLIHDFPNSKFCDEANLCLADIYYNQQDFNSAINYFKISVEELSYSQYFKLAYSYFQIDSLVSAKHFFSKLLLVESEYQSASKYYFAHISYKSKNYQTALNWFKQLQTDVKFKAIVPYYIAQIYYFSKDYRQLVNYVEPMIDNVVKSRKSELNRILGESYYRLKDYATALKYLQVYHSGETSISQTDFFMFAFSYYQALDYLNAVKYFRKINLSNDILSQFTSYYLAGCYLKLDNKKFALHAFKSASNLGFSKKIQEEAYFNYAKLAFELDLPFENALSIFQNFNDKFDSQDKEEYINSLMIIVLKGTSNYKDAYDALKESKDLSVNAKQLVQELAFFLAVKAYNDKKFNKAIELFKESNVYMFNQNILEASQFWLAESYYQLEEYSLAKDMYLALNSTSNNFLNHLSKYNLGYSYFKLGEFKNSANVFRAFIKLTSDSMLLNDALLRIADDFYLLKEFSLAEKFYEKSLDLNLFDLDYALYQRSACLGLINNKDKKVAILKQITRDYELSIYFDNALFDLAQHYKNNNLYSKALIYYDSVLVSTHDIEIQAKSYLSKAMIHYNNDDVNNAIKDYKFVISSFSNGLYFKQALMGLQSIYIGIAKVDEYIAFVNDLSDYSISESEQDSLSYNSAFIKFSEQDYKTSKIAFKKYINQFSEGIFIEDAHYYLAITSNNLGDSLLTNDCYRYIVDNNVGQYLEKSLIHLAREFYNKNDYLSSNIYYEALKPIASNNSLKREISVRLMYGYENINISKAVEYAKEVLMMDKIDNWIFSKANILISRLDFSHGNYVRVRKVCNQLIEVDNNSDGAEAMYMLIYLTYLDDSLDLAEKMIFEMTDDFSNDYFIAKAFILLADIYLSKGNSFQSKATLESIIDNYNGQDLKLIAKEKREKILESEIIVEDNIFIEDSYIDIFEDEIDYDLFLETENDTIN